MRLGSLMLLLTVLLPATAVAQDADSTAAQLALGKRTFEGRGLCWSCHGKAGEGALGPSTSLADGKWLHSKGSREEIVAIIKAGIDASKTRLGAAMPARGGSRISDREVEAVASYVVELAKQKPKT
jgi:mono/diheme cytochrome c family protein